ncbi:MAG: serine/threonine protein kinase [Gemmatimonadaceae bacterium]|nr:serine/threonine protein kinase [Gemmatimonadaceae bacterium]
MRNSVDAHPHVTLSIANRLLVSLSAVKIAGALVILAEAGFSKTLPGSTLHAGFIVLQLGAFSVCGAALLLGHAGDRRTQHLGIALLTIASAFSATYFQQLAVATGFLTPIAHLYPDAFLAYSLGRFVEVFPEPRVGPAARFVRALTTFSLITGVVLLIVNALPTVFGQLLARHDPNLSYWVIVFTPTLAVLAVAVSGGAAWTREDRRRVRWLLTSIGFGLGPMALSVLIASLPGIGAPFSTWMLSEWRPWLFNGALALLPVTVAYAVAVRRLLPLRLVARMATQHLLARWSVTAMTMVPLLFVGTHLYSHRASTVADVFTDRSLTLLVMSLVGGCAVVWREPLLRAIDRAFFRDVSLAADSLLDATERIRASASLAEMIDELLTVLSGTLRPDRAGVMVRNLAGEFIAHDGTVDPISRTAILVEILARAAEPIDVGNRVGDKLLRWLPEPEAAWLATTEARLLVPVRRADGALVAFMALGECKGDVSYGAEERRWLSHLADACGVAIDVNTSRDSRSHSTSSWQVGTARADDPARECGNCGAVFPTDTPRCPHCLVALAPAVVPLVLAAKFRIEQRIGRGGAGIVFRARDIALNRSVAIKTLPESSAVRAQRLQREAQRMASVMDPRLAIIYETNVWRGRPMLVCELMEHGTLADRLALGPLPESEALGLGAELAEALAVLHGKHVLHGDIKPSNVGFTADDRPKLLDFGLAQLLSDEPARPTAGTPSYMSPEALAGAPYSEMFDLWSLVVLLHEAITGTLPLRGDGDEAAAAALVRSALFFQQALATDPLRRPQSAGELAATLRHLAG